MRAFPIDEISRLLPHRPPMVWIDEVINVSEKGGQCRVILKSDAHYMGAEGLRPASCLEFIAQAYGYISACQHISKMGPQAKPLSKAFFASIRNASLPAPSVVATLRAGDELLISVDGVRQLSQIVSFSGQVHHGSNLLSEANIKVFKEYQH